MKYIYFFLAALLITVQAFAQTSFSLKTDVTTVTGPQAVAIGDLNGDGKPDMAVTAKGGSGYIDKVSVFLSTTATGASSPTFSAKVDFSTGSQPRQVVIADFNGDGKPDLGVANYSGAGTVSILLNTTANLASTPSFAAKTDFTSGNGTIPMAISDFNGDGKPDMVLGNSGADNVSVFLNTTTTGASTPTFATKLDLSTGDLPQGVAIGDFNGDGKPDIAVTNGTTSVSVFLNTTTTGALTPTFSVIANFTIGSAPLSVSVADFNGDGKQDLAVANNTSDNVSVLLNTTTTGASTPTFSAKTDFTSGDGPFCVSIGDFNGDGKPDMAVTNHNTTTYSVILNTTTTGASTPTFAAKLDLTVGTAPRLGAVGDLNGDGKPDLAAPNFSSATVSVLLNESVMLLPVELTTFTALVSANRVTLNWETATEQNNYGFEIERQKALVSNQNSVEEKNEWKKIGFVNGHGNSNSPKSYSFVDNSPLSGNNSYRLKQIDTDGIFKYSDVVEVNAGLPTKFELAQNYPNPFNPTTTIKFSLPETGYYSLKIFNALGQEVAQLVIGQLEGGNYSLPFDASKLASGLYFYNLKGTNVNISMKMILMK